jgi:uncharacterized membrane protein
MKIRFVLYGLLGWCLEVFWTGLGSFLLGDVTLRSRTSIWMFLIYGLAIFIEPVHDSLRDKPVIIRGGVYTILIYIIEFTTGLTLKLLLGVCPWNYSNLPLSPLNIITFCYVPAWFAAGLLFEKIHDLFISLGEIRRTAKQ